MSSLDDEHLTHHSPAAYSYQTTVMVAQWLEFEEIRELHIRNLLISLRSKYPITMGREHTVHEHYFRRVETGRMTKYEGDDEEYPETYDEICSPDQATHVLVMVEVIVPAWVEVELAVPRAVYP